MNARRKEYRVINMLSGLVQVVVAESKYEAINKGIDFFGVNQVRLSNR